MGLVRMILTLLPALPHFKPTEPFLPSLSRSSSFLHQIDSQSSDSRNNKATFAPSSERNRVLFHCSSQHLISDRRESKYRVRGFFSLALSPEANPPQYNLSGLSQILPFYLPYLLHELASTCLFSVESCRFESVICGGANSP